MKEINELLKQYDLKARSYNKLGKAVLVTTGEGKYVVKKKVDNNNIYDYLNSRSFNYYPKTLNSELDDYEISEYLEEVEMPDEQKMMDLIDLVSLLHSKTTYYKEISEDYYKKIYEDIHNNIEHLNGYYDDLMKVIESTLYMSPSQYLFARNISEIFNALNYCATELEKWYELVENKKKQRFVVLHNNLDMNHFIKSDQPYLISWNKSKIDIPIFDLYKLYKKHGSDYDFELILKRYETTYSLNEDERKLLFILISMPDKIEFAFSEYKMCLTVKKNYDNLFASDKLILSYNSSDIKDDS